MLRTRSIDKNYSKQTEEVQDYNGYERKGGCRDALRPTLTAGANEAPTTQGSRGLLRLGLGV